MSEHNHMPSPREESLSDSTQDIMDQKLWLKILIGMGLGVILGLILSPEGMALFNPELTGHLSEWLALPGVIFMGLIKMVIIPLIICSIILGISQSGDMGFLKSVGLRLVPYFILTTAIAISIGLALVYAIQPGQYIDQALIATLSDAKAAQTLPALRFDNLSIPQRISNIIPSNPLKAQLEYDMLQIVIASILLGIALITIPQVNRTFFSELCITGQMLSMKIISWAMALAPYAVFGILADITIKTGLDALLSVTVYAMTVFAGLLCMMLVYIAIVKFIAHIPVKSFLQNIKEVQLLAFSTSSSAATMPFSIEAAEKKLKFKPEISRIVIPLGATINMDGTALYQAIAAIFLCQVFGIDLTSTAVIALLLTTIGASIGTPATPGVGLIVLATILASLGVPDKGILLLIGVDRILDMCRTTINVTGDLTAASVMNRWIKAPHGMPNTDQEAAISR